MATVTGLKRHRHTMSHQVPPPGTVSSLLSSTSLALSGYRISQYVLSKNSLNNGVSGNLELSYTGSWRPQMLSRGDRTSAALPSMPILRAGPPGCQFYHVPEKGGL